MKLMFIGAHPDDAEFNAGGLLVQWRSIGHEVYLLSLTNGDAGHQSMAPAKLANQRQAEAQAAAARINAELDIWPIQDGLLEPTIALRHKLIGQIRRIKPDLIVTHRPADYHPDHRATSQLVQDATYLLQVPNIVPDVQVMESIPPVLLCSDRFSYPRPFRADIVIDISSVISTVIEMLHCHHSQVYEWLPHTLGIPTPNKDQHGWLEDWYSKKPANTAKRFAPADVAFAEAYEVSEYGGYIDRSLLTGLQTVEVDQS